MGRWGGVSLGASVASDGEFCPNAQRPSRFGPRSRKGGSTFLCGLEAAMSQVMLLPLVMARALHVQRSTHGRRAMALIISSESNVALPFPGCGPNNLRVRRNKCMITQVRSPGLIQT